MKLLTLRLPDGTTRVGRLDGPQDDDAASVVELDPAALGGATDVGALLAVDGWQQLAASAGGATHRYGDLDLAPLVPHPAKVVCVGLNYKAHILEMGRDLPEHPTLFAKWASTLTGPRDEVPLPPEDDALDWEGELVVVVGQRVRRADTAQAARAIAGYAVANDVSMRTWQFRTKEWLQGKVWDSSTPVGPVLTTADSWQPGPAITTRLNGEEVQSAPTDDLLFGPAELVSYVSTVLELAPGDLLLTGTPGGVGRARKPPRYLVDGDVVEVTVEGLGTLRNSVVAEQLPAQPSGQVG
ncbi:fumarylacetoacetate hydrolase family protein [Quadrisphaera oryzae]|uniref:fumarylacetoacetate hydrolase family protein n=1 Tax=Quadrisphaera TaxID=317661 RepID=UPI001646A849|nr:fumarylacetoacetate hydrolase family protein [Quadrisphaera sp. RL12-1S]MBC3763226.1 fumarylacetoacetate hydrolase family protein [Quadrisphaera sp. RL12-1S]